MDIVEAVKTRRSIRAFKSDAVPVSILKEILQQALMSPSWSNTQPWEFAIVTGVELDQIRKGFIERGEADGIVDIARPREFPEPYNTRLRAQASNQLQMKGIPREDKERRKWWRTQGLTHFGAPCVIYVLIDRAFYFQGDSINVWPVFDCGLIAENIMLLAPKYGLGTIPQAQAVFYCDVIKKVLALPDSKLVLIGITIGYPDWKEPINNFERAREPLDNVSKWYGFGEK